MNILFYYSSAINPLKGGVQRVTSVLSNYFSSLGYTVLFLSLDVDHSVTDKKQHYLPNSKRIISKENISFLESFVIENNIDYLINQAGHCPKCSGLLFESNLLKVRIISVIHNSLLASIKNLHSSKKTFFVKNHIHFLLPLFKKSFVQNLVLQMYRFKYKFHYVSLVENSLSVILLSDKFKEELLFFINSDFKKNISSIANPCSFADVNCEINKKENILLYVGRIDFSQKRVDLLLDIWEGVFLDYPNWKLYIVGDGPDYDSAKNIVKSKSIDRVVFTGYKDPKPFYERASIFCMTSSFEGFPMVLIEAMNYGVVPIAFDSFLSVSDIIQNKHNGVLVDSFNVGDYKKSLKEIIGNEEYFNILSYNAKEKSNDYMVEKIGSKWTELLNKY